MITMDENEHYIDSQIQGIQNPFQNLNMITMDENEHYIISISSLFDEDADEENT